MASAGFWIVVCWVVGLLCVGLLLVLLGCCCRCWAAAVVVVMVVMMLICDDNGDGGDGGFGGGGSGGGSGGSGGGGILAVIFTLLDSLFFFLGVLFSHNFRPDALCLRGEVDSRFGASSPSRSECQRNHMHLHIYCKHLAVTTCKP